MGFYRQCFAPEREQRGLGKPRQQMQQNHRRGGLDETVEITAYVSTFIASMGKLQPGKGQGQMQGRTPKEQAVEEQGSRLAYRTPLPVRVPHLLDAACIALDDSQAGPRVCRRKPSMSGLVT